MQKSRGHEYLNWNCPTSTEKTAGAKKPSSVTQKPSIVAKKPSSVAHKPSIVAKKPSSVAHKPSIVAKKPSSVAQKPPPVAQKPSIVAKKPSSVAQKPSPVAQKQTREYVEWHCDEAESLPDEYDDYDDVSEALREMDLALDDHTRLKSSREEEEEEERRVLDALDSLLDVHAKPPPVAPKSHKVRAKTAEKHDRNTTKADGLVSHGSESRHARTNAPAQVDHHRTQPTPSAQWNPPPARLPALDPTPTNAIVSIETSPVGATSFTPTHRALSSFGGLRPGEVTLQFDDVVEVLGQLKNGFCRVRTASGVGLVPSHFLKKISPTVHATPGASAVIYVGNESAATAPQPVRYAANVNTGAPEFPSERYTLAHMRGATHS